MTLDGKTASSSVRGQESQSEFHMIHHVFTSSLPLQTDK